MYTFTFSELDAVLTVWAIVSSLLNAFLLLLIFTSDRPNGGRK